MSLATQKGIWGFKGFLFSLDAIFALIVASAAVSILLYAHYTQLISYQPSPSQAVSIVNELANMNGATLASTYPLYAQLQSPALQTTWPQFAGSQALNSTSSYGPNAPEILFTFTSNGMDTPPVASQGLVAFGSGSRLYALNATTGAAVVNVSTGTAVSSAPLIYDSEIIYANASGYIDAVSTNASAASLGKIWATNVGAKVKSQLSLAGAYVGFGAAGGLYLLDPQTGAIVANVPLPSIGLNASAPLYINGEYVSTTPAPSGMNNVTAFSFTGSSLVPLWTRTIGSQATSSPAAFGGYIAFANGTAFTLLYPNGTLRYPPNSLGGAEKGGIAVGGGANPYAYVHTSNSLYILRATNGSGIFSVAVSNAVNGAYNGTPSVAQSTGLVYLLGGPVLQAYSSGSGAQKWVLNLIPSQTYGTSPSASLAYGNLYVSDGSTLYALGEFKTQQSQSAIDAMASMYLNGYGGPANLLMQSISSSYNDGMLINGRYAPAIGMANFNAVNSLVYIPDSNTISVSGNDITITGWFYAKTFKPSPGTSGFIAGKYGEYELGTNASSSFAARPWVSLNISGIEENYTADYQLSAGAWHFEAATFNGSSLSLFIDGNRVGNTMVAGALGRTSIPLLIGCMNIAGSCAGGASSEFNGSIAGVQLYGSALNSTQISELYQEGAEGSPISGVSNYGWWPLDGDANDYSGSAADGFAYNTMFNGTSYIPSGLSNAFELSKASLPLYISAYGRYSEYNVSIAVWR